MSAGAETSTRLAPASMWAVAAFLEVKKPVHSRAMLDAQRLVRQLRGIALGGDLDLAAADIDRVAVDLDLAVEAAVHGVEAEEVGVGLDRAEIVDRHDLDVLAARFHDRPHDVAADATEAVDCNPNCHVFLRYLLSRRAASAIASAVMPKCL